MGYRISKEFSFSASHQLLHLPRDHQCARLHGHNYAVRIELSAEDLNEQGFVYDYGKLHFLKRYIDDRFDHRHLNEVFGNDSGQLTTAEALAAHFASFVAQHLMMVREGRNITAIAAHVSETPKTWATYEILASEDLDTMMTRRNQNPLPLAGF